MSDDSDDHTTVDTTVDTTEDAGDEPGGQARTLTIAEATEMAISFHRHGRLGEAEVLYTKIIEQEPQHPDALHFLGVLRHQAGRNDEAIELLRQAVAIAPDHPDVHNNLGNVLKRMGRLDDARAELERAVALRPDFADAYNNLAAVLRALERYPEAERACRAAIRIAPRHAEAHHNLGNILGHMNRDAEALAAYRKSIELRPDQGNTYHSLAGYLGHAGRLADAAAVLREWLAFEPDNPVPRHLLAACTAEDVPERASDAFVREHFDQFAERFDRQLVESLRYQAPELVGQALARALGAPRGDLDVLDAGCGTGLGAPHLRPYARRLVGIDLSAAMLEKARQRGGYDALAVAELTAYLDAEAAAGAFDLIASIDTLCYFGALEAVLAGAARALRPGGLLAFSVERLDGDAAEPHRLQPQGRYSHARPYLEAALRGAGFQPREITGSTLRMDAGRPVAGWIVTASRAAA